MKNQNINLFVIGLVLASYALSPALCAACREDCDSTENTFLGDNALISLTTGYENTAIGYIALQQNTTGYKNTAVGAYALEANTGNENTAIGDQALTLNTTGSDNTATGTLALTWNTTGADNTANGAFALYNNYTGSRNVANGFQALRANSSGIDNTATGMNALYTNNGNYNTADGYKALEKNTTGSSNTASGLNALNKNTIGSSNAANGAYALYSNSSGIDNTASGFDALYSNINGPNNTASGYGALFSNISGPANTAIGSNALYSNTSGGSNIVLGFQAGFNLTTGSFNIDIGNAGVAAEANTIRIGTVGSQSNAYIAGISGVTVAGGIGVIVDGSGHLGTVVSSARFKEAIQPMDKASEAILGLKPVTFRYRHELDPEAIPQFGLIAEEVEKVNPALVARDDEGKPYTVRYEAVNAMLLNEFLKEHRKVEELEGAVAEQQSTNSELRKEIGELKAAMREQAAEIRKVSDKAALNRSTPQMVASNQ